MILGERFQREVRFQGELDLNGVAYVDNDWLGAARDRPLPALVAVGETLSWNGLTGRVVREQAVTGDEHVALLLASFAKAAVDRLDDFGSAEHVEVSGTGIVAEFCRRLISPPAGDRRPTAWIDTTGDRETLALAVARVEDGGMICLLGEELDRDLSLDLYWDVHRRGLRIVGIPSALHGDVREVPQHLPAPQAARLGEHVPVSLWYRVTS